MKEEKAISVLSWMEKAHFYGSPAAYLARIPSAYFLHSIPGNHWTNQIAPWFATKAILCCGQSVQKAQARRYPHRTTRLAYIAVDLEKFDPSALPAPSEAKMKLGFAHDSVIVGITARLQHWKGVHVFLKAASLIAKLHPEVTFLVVGGIHEGEPNYLAELQQQIEDDGIVERVHFAGHQTNVPLWMQAMDILVHCSDNEPTGTVIIEGMALGKPVIAAKTVGPMEFVTEGEDGLLVRPGDADALSMAVCRLLGNEDLREKIARAARLRAVQFGAPRLASDVGQHMCAISLRSPDILASLVHDDTKL